MPKADITVLIPCMNNRSFLERFVPSCNWAAEVLVVDSFSSDGSAKIANSLGARVFQRVYDTSARQKNCALDQVNTEWVFQIDTDEMMEQGLLEEITTAVREVRPSVSAFRIPRKNHYGKHWLRYGGVYPDYQTRLFRRDRCRWQDRQVHAQLKVEGETGTLTKHILHYGMPSISKQIVNLDRYTTYERDEKLKSGMRADLFRLLFHPPLVFAYRYLWLRGFLDGWRGLVLAMYTAVYDFVTIVKMLEAIKEKGYIKANENGNA